MFRLCFLVFMHHISTNVKSSAKLSHFPCLWCFCVTEEKNLKHFTCFPFLSWHYHDIVKWNYLVMCILEISLFLAANCSFLLLNYCRRCQCVKICIFKILLSWFCIECDTIARLIFSLFHIFKQIMQMQHICLHFILMYNNRVLLVNIVRSQINLNYFLSVHSMMFQIIRVLYIIYSVVRYDKI